jgi:Xaa-Pro dipeptidase
MESATSKHPSHPSVDRRAELAAAEQKANQLMEAIESARLISPGRTERQVEDGIYELAAHQFAVEKHWHKRIVRAGAYTLTIASDDPPVRIIEPDDIVYIDLGPVFEEWEADIGRSFVLGNHPEKSKLVSDLSRVFDQIQRHYRDLPNITGADLYEFGQKAVDGAGWDFGGAIAGHLVSEFPHVGIPGNKDLNRIGPCNFKRMRDSDELGRERHWILEVHLVDKARTFGGFYERLL